MWITRLATHLAKLEHKQWDPLPIDQKIHFMELAWDIGNSGKFMSPLYDGPMSYRGEAI